MLKIKSIPLCIMGVVPVLLLSACASDKGVVVEPSKNTLPAGSVVMLDPASDDSMLPAIGEQMSKGAVTIYRLDGPQAPVPAQSANQVFSPMQGVAPGTPMPSAQRIQLNPPAGVNPSAAPDPRVTVFGVDGNPVNTASMPMSGSVTYIQPGGVPPVISAVPMTPSMMPAPRIAPPPPPTTLNSPFAADGTIAMTPDTSARAVSVAPISPDRLATPTKRPPKGMTY